MKILFPPNGEPIKYFDDGSIAYVEAEIIVENAPDNPELAIPLKVRIDPVLSSEIDSPSLIVHSYALYRRYYKNSNGWSKYWLINGSELGLT